MNVKTIFNSVNRLVQKRPAIGWMILVAFALCALTTVFGMVSDVVNGFRDGWNAY